VAQQKMNELREKKAQLLKHVTEEWPEVTLIKNQMAELEKQISEEDSREQDVVLTNLKTAYNQALSREQSRRDAFNQQNADPQTQNEASVNYKIIQQEIDTSKGFLDGLLKSSRENEIMIAGVPNNIHVTDYALTPGGPVGPKRFLGISVVFLCSLFFGTGLSLLFARSDDMLHSVDQVESALGLPVLGSIPSARKLQQHSSYKNALSIQRPGEKKPAHPELLLNGNARSPLAESYRKLRTSILRSSGGPSPKTLLVTSSLPSEGKTTTAINTALMLAATGASVLLIDADLRHPSHHAIFNVENDLGLSSILIEHKSNEAIFSAIQKLDEQKINFMSAGPITDSAAELLGSEEMLRVLDVLTDKFDHIVIDSPPIAYFTDSIILSSVVDGVLLVVNGGKTSGTVVKRSWKEMEEVGANVLGVVINNLATISQEYYSYSYYR
jgi:succinoglycan biosynthesis transport protein ExoP